MNSQKNFLFLFIFISLLLFSSLVLADTTNYYPTSGVDYTDNVSGYLMNAVDLAKVAKSDDDRYTSQGFWAVSGEYIIWEFSPGLSSNSEIEDVVLDFEFQKGEVVMPVFSFWYWKESSSKWEDLSLKFELNSSFDFHFVKDIPLSKVNDINNLKIRFQAYDVPNGSTAHDLVEVKVDYFLDDDAPECSVDYFKKKGQYTNKYVFADSVYIPEESDFYVFGSSMDESSNIVNVQYNRTSPNIPPVTFTDADPVDNAYNSKNEDWATDPNDPKYIKGDHRLCCLAVDEYNNKGESCVDVCIDIEKPDDSGNITFDNPGECVFNYVNFAPKFSWEKVSDNGCAGIDYYMVEVYYSNGTLYYTKKVEGTSHTVVDPVNGEDYYIRVRAVDRAGHMGGWSPYSEHVWYDSEDPEVTITNPKQGSWFKDDFNLSELDTDNMGLYKCEYRIVNNGNTIVDWSGTVCNEDILVDISSVCPDDKICTVHKRVTDKACNMDSTHKYYYLDRIAPVTTKTVSNPKYSSGPNMTWMGHLIHFFIKPETEISLKCDDGVLGSGCAGTYYRIDSGNWTMYNGSFTLGTEDRVYLVEYYSEDVVGNKEKEQTEKDKVDTIAPVTKAIFGNPQFFGYREIIEDLNVWMRFINSDTEITLDATDSQVGVNKTYFGILTPCEGEIEDNGRCDHEEWYGNDKKIWYENGTVCLSENSVCNITYWESKDYCSEETYFDEEIGMEICPYEEPITIEDYCDHKICYYSKDHLDNVEEQSCEVFSVDNKAPTSFLHNPTKDEEFRRCYESVVVELFDDKSGIDAGTVYASLYDYNETKVRGPVKLKEAAYKGLLGGTIFEGLMNTELPAGEYVLRVDYDDNVGNKGYKLFQQELAEGVYVEYLYPGSCTVSVANGGSCKLGFNVCMRGADSVKMWMDKLAEDPKLVTPDMLNARIVYENNSALVGLLKVSEAGKLEFGNVVNGKKTFSLMLDFSTNITNVIGGSNQIDYFLEAHN